MKFLLIVLAVHLVFEILTRKENKNKVQDGGNRSNDVRHPAEYELR